MKTLFRLTLLLWTIFSIAGIAQAGSLPQSPLILSQGSNNVSNPVVGLTEVFGASGGSGTGDYYWTITGPATILMGGNQGDNSVIIKYTGAGDVTISLYKLPDTSYMIASTSLIKTAINNPPSKASISASSTNITVGNSVTFTMAASDPDGNLDRLNLDVISPNNGFFQANAGPYTFDGNPPNNGGYTFPWTASKVQNCTVTFATANTYQFRTATGDGVLGWYSPSYSDPVTVYVNKASPGVSFSSTGNMNVGGSTTLSASTSGGYNPTGGFSYSVISQNGATAHVSGSTLYIDGLTSAPGQVTVRATYNGDGNNNSNYADQVVTVNPIAVTLTSSTSQGFSYDGSAKTPTVSWSAGSGYSVSSGTASATNAGNYSVTVSANYPYSGSGTISYSISKATPTISWATPAAISYGTALSATQLNASTGIAGTYTYTPVSGTVLGAGSQTLSVHFVPTDTTNYNTPSDKTVSLTVNKVGANVPTVSASANPVALGSSVTFTPGNGTTNNYAWFINGTQVTSGTGGTWSPTSGSYANGSWYTSGFNLIVTPSNTTGFSIVFRDTGNSNYNYTDSATLNETVSNSAPVVSSFSASPSTINFGQTATISATITDSNSNLYAFAIMRFDGSNYYRLPGVDQSRGWGNSYSIDTTSGTYSSQPSNDVASGSTSTWSFNYRPSSATSTQFHANGHDGIAWAGGTQYITLTVNKATQSLSTLSNQNFTYGTPITASWLNVVASNPYSGAVTAPAAVTYTASSYGAISAGTVLPVGTYTITATSAADGNYTGNTTTATFTVNKATPTVSWSTPAGITYGTALSGTQLNATASVPGSFSYSPASGAVLGAGTQSLSVNFTPTDTANYNSVNGTTVSLSVSKASLSVTANSPSVSFTGSAYAGTPGVTYSGFVNGDTSAVVSGSPTYSYSPVSPTNAGSYTITPAIGTLAAANYTFSFVSGTLTIGKITPTVSWSTPSAITYGNALSSTQLNASGSVAGSYTYTPAAGSVLGAGSQTLSVHFVPTDTTNYNVPTDKTVSLTVNKATLSVTANSPSVSYTGSAYAGTPGVVLSGFVNGDTSAVVSGAASYSYSPATPTAAGSYTVTPTVGTLAAANYTFSFVSGTLTIGKITPTLSWSTPAAITYGTALSATQLNASVSVAGTYTYTPGSGTVLGYGSQTLSVHFVPTDTTNYNTPTDATVSVTVNKAALTMSGAYASSKQYDGTSTATVTAGTLVGVQNADTLTVSGTTGTFPSAAAGENLAVTPSFSISGAKSANYTFSQPSLTANIYPAIPTSISNSTFVVDDSGTNAIATQGTFHYGQKLKLTTTGNATGGWLSRITQYLRLNSGPWSWESGQNAYPWDGGVYLTMDTASPSAVTTSASRTVYLTPTAYGTYDINTEAWTGFADNRAPLGWSGSGIQLWGGTFYYVKTSPVINFSNSTISYGTTLSGLLNAAWKNPYLSSASSTTGTTTYTASATSGGTGWTNGSAVTNATVLPAGVYTVTANVTADTNYNASSGTATFTVNALASTVTGSLTYGTVTYGSTAATATVPTATNATISYSSSDTSIATVNSSSGLITPVKAGSVVITANITPSTNYAYTGSAITANVTVNKATPTWTWVPTTLDEATPLSAAQLNATASVPGTFTYNPSSGTLAGGDQTLTAHFVPTDSNYNEVDATANITVLKVPTINWTISTGAGQFTSTDKTTISESAGFTADQLNATVSYGGTDVTASGTGKYFSVPKNAYVTTGTTMYGNRGYGILRFTWSATGYKTVSLEKTILVDTPATLVSMSASLPTVVVGQPVTVTATASDVDGNLNRIAVAIAGPKYEALYTGGAAAITPTPYLGLHWLQEGAVDIFTYTGSNTVTRTVTPTLVGTYYGNMQAATSYYWTANYATSLCSFNAIAASPTVTFSALPNSMAVGASTSMSASITGGYNPSGSIAYSITSQNGATASISGNTLTINSRTAASATITVRAAYAGDTNNNSCYADQVVTVDQITPTVTWTTPQSVNEGSTLAAVLNAAGSVPGAISYKEGMATVDASTVLAAGAHTLTATLNPTDSLTYNTASTTATVYVLKIPSISWTLSATTYNSGLININKVPVTSFSGSSSSAMPMLGAVFTSGATTLTTADGTFVYTNETNSNAVVTTGTPMAIPGNNVLRVTFTPKAGVNVYASATTTATVFVNQQPTVSITALDNATSTTNQIVIGQKVKIVTTITDADSNMSNAVVLWSGPQASAENTGTGLGTFPTTGGYWYALGYPPFTASYSLSTSIKTTSVLGTHYVSYQVKDVSSWLNAYTTASATFDVIQASPTVSFNALASMEAGSSVTMSAATAGGYNPTGAITYSVQTQTSATAHVSGSALIIDSVTGSSGTIKVRATYPGDTNNTSAYAEQTITVYPALSIATQPVSQIKSTGTALGAISVVAANGSTPYTYQWYSNTTNSTSGATLLSGATSSSYTPTDTVVGTYYYFVNVTDALAVTATSNVTSQVIVPKPVAGITATKTTVNYGESTTITMTATEGLPGTISQHSMVWDSGLNHIWTGIGTSGWGYPSDTTNLTGISDQTNSPTGANSSTKTATYTPTFLGSTVFRSWAYNNASPAAQNGTQITITTVASTPVVQNWANKSITATSGTYTVQAGDLSASFVNAYNVAFPAPVGAVTYKDQSNNTITVGSVLTAGSTYAITATVPAETNYLAGSAAVTWTLSKGPQPTLTLVANSSMTYPIAQTLSTTGGAGSGSVTYTVVSGPGSISGSTLTPTGAGTIVVHANKAADGQYNAISSADVSITVAKAVATVSINPTTSTIELGQSATFTATSSSGNVAWSGAATGTGATKTVTPATVGTFTVTVTDNGDSNYSASTSTSATLTVTAKTDTIATITSNAGTNVVVGSQITLPATTGNGVALTYTIKSNGISVPGTWAGNVFTLTQRLLSSNATLDVSATSVGDTNNKAISKSVQFTFTNNAPVVVVKTP